MKALNGLRGNRLNIAKASLPKSSILLKCYCCQSESLVSHRLTYPFTLRSIQRLAFDNPQGIAMSNIKAIVSDGFSLQEYAGRIKDLALLSLRIGLKAYCETSRSMRMQMHLFDGDRDEDTINFHHTAAYIENFAEAILHIQHFIELVCKDFLREEHPLLAVDASKRPSIMHKLLKEETVELADMEGLKSLEFSESFDRLIKLIKNNRIGSGKLDFLIESSEALKHLNILRNRIWHRGTFVLRYPSMDEFLGKHILPVIQQITDLPEFSSHSNLWGHKALRCGIEPIKELITENKVTAPNFRKMALLKELGRAAYSNPIQDHSFSFFLNQEIKQRAQRLAKSEVLDHRAIELEDCPVCGIESLVIYEDVEVEDADPDAIDNSRAWRYTWKVTCMCCTFEIYDELRNASSYGLPIPDYWKVEEIG